MSRRVIFPVFIVLGAGGLLRAAPGEVTGEIPAPAKNCTGLAFDGTSLWVGDHLQDAIFKLDAAGGKVTARLKSPGRRPAGLAFDGEQLWNVDALTTKIYRMRPADGLVTRTVPAPVQLPRALAWDGKALWLSDEAGRTIHQVDAQDGTTIREIPFPSQSVDALAFDGRYLWVADRLDDRLYAVHVDSGEVVAGLPAPGPHAIGLAAAGERLWALDYQNDRIYSLQADDKDHLILGRPVSEWVVFHHQVRNLGPDAVRDLEVLMAVPEESVFQRLESLSFTPRPQSEPQDRYGQKAARFFYPRLEAGGEVESRLQARVRMRQVDWMIYPHKVGKLGDIPPAIRRTYLGDEPKYDIHHPAIRRAVLRAVGGEKNPFWIARRVYRHVHRKMRYERVGGWDVAPKVLERGSGSCSEYSYVYIAMCRAAGLPARYVGSLVMRKDQASWDDVFHRWVEVYLPPYGWVPVDPSRGDKPGEAERADSFGHLTPDFLVTTQSGGGSELLDWNYDYNQRYQCEGRCQVDVEPIAEWSPEEPASE